MSRATWLIVAVVVLATAAPIGVSAQGLLDDPAAQPTEGVELGGDDEPPPDPSAQLAPPRALVVGGDLPDVPDRRPDRFAVMAFENRSPVHALDWMTAGVPLSLGEKVEHQLGLDPAYDAWVVPPGPVVPASAATVAAFATPLGARWVWTGWVERPNWQLRLAISLWRVDGGVATSVGEVVEVASFDDVHRLVGLAASQLAIAAGFKLTEAQQTALGAPASRDLYAFTLIGRGVAHLRGVLGRVDVDGARRDVERAIFIEPTMAIGQRLVGELWLAFPKDAKAATKSAARAAGKFSYAVDLQPGYLPAVRASATAARASGKPDIARELYERVVRMRPWDLEARIFLGEARWQTGDSDGALRELLRVIKRDPNELRARRLIALVHADRGNLGDLVTALEEIARRAPEDVATRMDLGAAYAALGRWDDARDAYVKVAIARPADVGVLKLVGDVERRRGDPTAASSWYARMLKAAPDDPRPNFLIGQTWIAAGDLAKAHKAFLHAQDAKDYLGYSYAALGAVQYRNGNLDEALWYLKRASVRRPHSAPARIAHARVLLAKHDGAAALAEVAAARALGGEGAELDYLAALGMALEGDVAAARTKIRAALVATPAMVEARRAQAMIDRGEAPEVEGTPSIDVPFGDVDAFEAAIDGFIAADLRMAGVRLQLDTRYLEALAALGEGPGKDLSKEARRKPRSRTCPFVQVARPWAAARALERELVRRGLVLEEAYRTVALLAGLGESVGLTPDYRRKVGEIRVAWRRARFGVREVRSELTNQLGRELKSRRCKDDVLVAAAARPDLYGRPAEPVASFGKSTDKAPRPPLTATLYIDNRECIDPVELWIDGEELGTAPGGQRSAFETRAGQRTLCMLSPGEAGSCGDRGTVRQAYLHDGWSAMMRCRGEGRRSVDAMPTPTAPPGPSGQVASEGEDQAGP